MTRTIQLTMTLILMAIVTACFPPFRHYSIDYPSPIEEGNVYYSNPPYPTMVMTFAPGVPHIEPEDGNEVYRATTMCQYFLKHPDSYPVRMHKKKIREYLTVCHDPRDQGSTR